MPNALKKLCIATALLLTYLPTLAQAQIADKIEQGVVDFAIEYEDVGAMASMLPKTQKVYFRPGQRRVEMGPTVILSGVEPGRQIQLLDLGGQKIAISLPETMDPSSNDLRVENTKNVEEVAGLKAVQVDLVDILDPSNRLPVLITQQIDSVSTWLHPDISGFALDYYTPIQEGLGHWRAQKVEAIKVDSSLFLIPSEYKRFELDSQEQLQTKLQELLVGDVEIVQ